MDKKERKPRISKNKANELKRYFVGGITARSAASLAKVNRHTATNLFKKWRVIIAQKIEHAFPFKGAIEIDESYFGGRRKGKRGRGAAQKILVFGLLKRGGKVYVSPISDAKATTLIPIINQKVQNDSIIYTDSFKSYNKIDISKFHHERINHSETFVNKLNHINGIENFWSQAKRHLRKFNGIPKANFHYFIKECEWRFNYGSASNLLKILNRWLKSEN